MRGWMSDSRRPPGGRRSLQASAAGVGSQGRPARAERSELRSGVLDGREQRSYQENCCSRRSTSPTAESLSPRDRHCPNAARIQPAARHEPPSTWPGEPAQGPPDSPTITPGEPALGSVFKAACVRYPAAAPERFPRAGVPFGARLVQERRRYEVPDVVVLATVIANIGQRPRCRPSPPPAGAALRLFIRCQGTVEAVDRPTNAA